MTPVYFLPIRVIVRMLKIVAFGAVLIGLLSLGSEDSSPAIFVWAGVVYLVALFVGWLFR